MMPIAIVQTRLCFGGEMSIEPHGKFWSAGNTAVGNVQPCGLGLEASYANTTLGMTFQLGITTPATWSTYLFTSGGRTQLWSKPLPTTVLPAPFSAQDGPGFPPMGNVGVLSSLVTPSGQPLCVESTVVETGGAGLSSGEALRLIEAGRPVPIQPYSTFRAGRGWRPEESGRGPL